MSKTKQISIKPLLKIMKELKEDRRLGQDRVDDFRDELETTIKDHNILLDELQKMKKRIHKLEHLIEMYSVIDDHKIMDLWELETACGLTKKKYPQWEFDFQKTKDSWIFK